MTLATVRAPRPVKKPIFADFFVRDLQRRFDNVDAQLLRRWERLAEDAQELRS